MSGITDHPDDFDREWAYRRGYAHGAEAVVATLRPHLPEAIRRKAEVWLACELIFWRAQFQPKMTQPISRPIVLGTLSPSPSRFSPQTLRRLRWAGPREPQSSRLRLS
jgi:hypothetical protein